MEMMPGRGMMMIEGMEMMGEWCDGDVGRARNGGMEMVEGVV